MEEFVAFGSREYVWLLALLGVARGSDFLSTWIATPNLELEANPIARRLGWRWGLVVNALLVLAFAAWPLPAIVIATSSSLVAVRNFQMAWVMRGMGEQRYRCWMAERVTQTPFPLFLFCLFAQSVLLSGIGAALMAFSGWRLVPFAVGAGVITYALAVTLFTLLSVWRLRRSLS